jgi:hypothetical protein
MFGIRAVLFAVVFFFLVSWRKLSLWLWSDTTQPVVNIPFFVHTISYVTFPLERICEALREFWWLGASSVVVRTTSIDPKSGSVRPLEAQPRWVHIVLYGNKFSAASSCSLCLSWTMLNYFTSRNVHHSTSSAPQNFYTSYSH